MSGGWTGSVVRAARAHWTPLLPLPCARCGLLVTTEHRWHVGHIIDRALGGGNDIANTWPEHGRCNESAGGRLGHRLNDRPKPKRRDLVRASVPVVRRREW